MIMPWLSLVTDYDVMLLAAYMYFTIQIVLIRKKAMLVLLKCKRGIPFY